MRWIRKPFLVIPAVSLALALLASLPASASDRSLAPAERPRVAGDLAAPERFSGEIVVKTYYHEVVIAVDEADSAGRTDGRVDHLFFFTMLVPDVVPGTFWDPTAEVEIRPAGLRVLAHTQQRELELLMNGAAPPPGPLAASYSRQVFEAGIELYRYSGAILGDLSLADVEQRGREILGSLRQNEKQITPQNPAPPETEGGGSCAPTCTTHGCDAGACSAACLSGYCAKCSCLGSVPPTYPSCFCAPK